MSIEVIRPGALSTLQDLGRIGYQRYGVSVGGAMDEWSHRIANRLVGNAESEATLELTLVGPSLKFTRPTLIAITGADLSPSIGGQAIPKSVPVLVGGGAQLDFGRRISGVRSYLAVRGGYDVPCVMGSKTTSLRGAFGGFEGRALRKGDVLPLGTGDEGATPRRSPILRDGQEPFSAMGSGIQMAGAGNDQEVIHLRVMPGRHWDRFNAEAREGFLKEEFRLSPQSDRMGFRLHGPKLLSAESGELLSEAVCFGAIQVPPSGDPIILMADRQTTGGYPMIAAVASVDLPALAQLMPQRAVRFTLITLAEAQSLDLERERSLAEMPRFIWN